MERNGQRYYYHADGLGSITSITDANQAVVNRYAYDSFVAIKKSETIRNAYAFTGREFDSETGLYYYRARYYDPEVGRFVSKDPIGFAGGDVNVFGIVDNNSVNLIDPYGLKSKKYWVPPDLIPPQTTPTPDSGTLNYPYAPSNDNSCPTCVPKFHSNVYWSCVGNLVSEYAVSYLEAVVGMIYPSGFTQAAGFIGAVSLSNYIGCNEMVFT